METNFVSSPKMRQDNTQTEISDAEGEDTYLALLKCFYEIGNQR